MRNISKDEIALYKENAKRVVEMRGDDEKDCAGTHVHRELLLVERVKDSEAILLRLPKFF
jgi:hypothetical protein